MKTIDKEVGRLLATADIYRVISIAFSYPERERLEDLSFLVDEMAEGLDYLPFDIRAEFNAFRGSLQGISREEIESEYTELFLTRMLCPPYESRYVKEGFNKSEVLADIAGFYNAFGFTLAGPDMADHIAAETEFLSLLSLKETMGIEEGLKEMVDVCSTAKKRFLEAHPGRWVESFCKNLVERTRIEFYKKLAMLTERLIGAEKDFYSIRIKPLEEVPEEDLGEMRCPSGIPQWPE